MLSNRMVRNMSLESGVTPRRLNHVVLPEPGSPIAKTTTPRGALLSWGIAAWLGAGVVGCRRISSAEAGGIDGDSGWVTICIRSSANVRDSRRTVGLFSEPEGGSV